MSRWFAAYNTHAWQLCRWILDCSRATAGTGERVGDRPRAGKIVAASLSWSEGYAAGRIEFARQVLERLPRLGQWMCEGRLEERKAADIVAMVADLDDAQAREVVDKVLDAAPRLAFTALRARVAAEAAAVDPGWFERRRAAAIARRRVSLRVGPSGAAELCGLDLPEDPAQDAHDRIVALARAASKRLTRAGVRGCSVGEVESEVMLTLTGPDGAGMFDLDVVDHVVARLTRPDDGPDSDSDDPGPGPDNPEPGPAATGPGTDQPRPDDGPGPGPEHVGPDLGPDDPDLDDDRPEDHGPGVDPDDCDPPGAGPEGACLNGAARTDLPGEPTSPPGGPGNRARARCRSGSEVGPAVVAFAPRVVLRLGLATVLGLDRRPGELPGRGVVSNSAAVAMAWTRAHARFRVLLHDDHGALEHVLSIRPPTSRPPPVGGRRRHHLIEVTAHTRELEHLAAALGPAWLRPDPPPELAAPPHGTPVIRGDALELLHRAVRALERERARPPDQHPAITRAEAGNRFPSARLRDWVQARDRTCRALGCSADAVGCDVDHTVPVINGGLTVAEDLGAFCRRDHLFKHDPDTGWSVRQSSAGRFEWTSPTGRIHLVEPEPYEPLLDPVPRTDRSGSSLPGELLEPPPRTRPPGSPRPNRHGLLTDAARSTAAHLRRRAAAADATADPGTPLLPDPYPDEPPF